jgi:putative transposase
MRQHYPDDLTDEEWALIAPHLERSEVRGRKPKYAVREMMNAIYYVLRTGCSWRNLPHDFPPWQSVFTRFRRFRDAGIFEKVHLRLLALERVFSGRNLKVSGAIVDSQSVKTTQGGVRGFCGAKKVNGRKRHILTDTCGNMINVHMTAANENDRDGLVALLSATEKLGFNPKKNMG